jgi:putative ABC transport system ATP-binding protein
METADLIDGLTVAQNICIRQLLGGGHPARLFATPATWRRAVAATLTADAYGEGADLEEIVGNLSNGLKQMISVAIAVTLEHRQNPCRLLLLDEHTARLDHKNKVSVMEFTDGQIKSSGATTVMVTHRYEDALQYASRIIVLRDGKTHENLLAKDISSEKELAKIVEGGT